MYVGHHPIAYPHADAFEMEKAIYANKLHGPTFDEGNQKNFVALQLKVSNTPKAEWICDFEATYNGHGAIMKLHEVHKGEVAIRHQVTILNEDSSIQYHGEYTDLNFHAYTIQLQKAFYIMGKHQQAYTDFLKVARLCAGFKCHEDKLVDMALYHVKDNKIDDYQGAVLYLGDKVLIAFPPKIGDGAKKHIGGAISPCKIRKAAKVKGKGRAHVGKTFNSLTVLTSLMTSPWMNGINGRGWKKFHQDIPGGLSSQGQGHGQDVQGFQSNDQQRRG